MFNSYRFNRNDAIVHRHQWVTVLNPANQRALLQACDNCGVVRSENTHLQVCQAKPHQNLITSALQAVNL